MRDRRESREQIGERGGSSKTPKASAAGMWGKEGMKVVRCNKLKAMEWISRLDPYVVALAGASPYKCWMNSKHRTYEELADVFATLKGASAMIQQAPIVNNIMSPPPST
ncbi:hypothetical protein R6Q59_012106 [Mikania micrantha]